MKSAKRNSDASNEEKRLIIGTYILQPYAQTKEQIIRMAECGIRRIVCLRPCENNIFEWLKEYDMDCILAGVFPDWWGGASPSGEMKQINPMDRYNDAVASFPDHSAVFGADIGDEPSSKDFAYLGEIVKKLKQRIPGKTPYLNLLPNYGTISGNTSEQIQKQLGTEDYEEYIRQYVRQIDLPYISYDFYVYSLHDPIQMFENLRIVSDACLNADKQLWYIAQVNSSDEDGSLSENQLRFQAYSALAYGAVALNWACWTKGWWYHNVLDENGNVTEQYEKLKRVNRELICLSTELMRYKRIHTYLIGFPFEEKLGMDFINGFSVSAQAKLVIGEFVGREHQQDHALLILNATDYLGGDYSPAKISFYTEKNVILYTECFQRPISKQPDGRISLFLKNCHGILLILH